MILEVLDSGSRLESLVNSLIEQGGHLGWTLIKAVIVFTVGRFAIRLINRIVRRVLERHDFELSLKTFIGSLVNVTLMVLLIISVVGALGVQTTSFAALIASAGVAVGMALSGNLSNFAGGLLILLFKPFKVGDYIVAQGTEGTVREIQIFHTVLITVDNKDVFIPNGSLSSGVITNIGKEPTRRVDWTFGVDYGSDYERVKSVIESVLAADGRILKDPAPFIALGALADSSVNITVRVWVNTADYWGVFFDINKAIYTRFNAEGIDFPFPQLTVHRSEK